MLDFTSALYLGWRHPSAALGHWEGLSQGRPAALREPPGATALAERLAQLQGCEAALLLPSTLHLFWDLLRLLADRSTVILVDAGSYAIARWGAQCAATRGARVESFAHHDVAAGARLARRARARHERPIILADGYCTQCGRAAPLAGYARVARDCGGYLVLDDTQALGILGARPTAASPYGSGGGGSLRWQGLAGPHIVVGASLAKAFAAPLAVLAGSRALIQRFIQRSETRLHCSPPSVAAIRAASRALALNRACGDARRSRLLALVRRLRRQLKPLGLQPACAMPFPVQSFVGAPGPPPAWLQQRLRDGGIDALLTGSGQHGTPRLTLLVSAGHRPRDIDRVAAVLTAR